MRVGPYCIAQQPGESMHSCSLTSHQRGLNPASSAVFGHKMLKSSFFINIRNMLDNKSTYLSAFRSLRTWLCMVLNTDKEAFWSLPHKFRVTFFIITLSTSCNICFECSK